MSKIKVVIYSFDKPKWVCAHIRILQYLKQWLPDIEIIYGVTFNEDGNMQVNNGCVDYGDIFILQRFFPCPETDNVLSLLWDSGKPVIYDTDDFLTELLADRMQKPEQADMIMKVIEKVDLVTVSTQKLLEIYQPYARNIKVIPNLIDEHLWDLEFLNKRDTDKLVIAYYGTPTHIDDLRLVEEALIHIVNKYKDKVLLRLFGCSTDNLSTHPNIECRDFTDSYFEYIHQSQKTAVDIAIGPISDNIFNQCKSNIKWLEYSIRGIAGIFTNIGPYKETIKNGETGLLVDNNYQDWVEALESLIVNNELRENIAINARQEVHQNYSLNKDRVDYLGLLKDLLESSRHSENAQDKSSIDSSVIPNLDINNVNDRYQLWLKQHQMSEIDAQIYAERMCHKWTNKPVFHIFCLATVGDNDCLIHTITSLVSQLYKHWVLTIISDAACDIDGLENIENIDWLHSKDTISDLNKTLSHSDADWVMLFNEGTILEPDTLIAVADHINEQPQWQCLYTDHDSYEKPSYYQDPFFKPDINCEYLHAMNYVKDAVAFRRESLCEIGAYSELPVLHNYDVILRMITHYGTTAIGHIDNVLFHFHKTYSDYSEAIHKNILHHYFSRQDSSVDILQGYLPETLRLNYSLVAQPLVSIIIPSRDMLEYLQPCVDGIFEITTYKNYEVIVVDNGSEDADVFAYYQQMREAHGERFRVIEYAFEFNYSAMINLGVDTAHGEYVLQLNNDTLIIQSEWLERMVRHAQRPEVGVVGAKLLYPGTGKIQHAGIFMGMHEVAGHPYIETADSKDAGYMNRLQVDQELSAVTGACLLARKSLYEELGGMNDKDLKVCYNDIDLCLKMREAGYKVIWSAYSIVLHHGSVSQIETESVYEKKLKGLTRFKGEQAWVLDHWRAYIKHDPAYNRHLTFSGVSPEPDYTCVINWMNCSKERPRIFGMPVSGGSGEYRVKAPLRSLARAGHAHIDFTYSASIERQRVLLASELIRIEADAILVQNFLGDSSIDALEKYKKYTDIFMSYALDDLITNLPEGNEYRRNIPMNARTRLRRALKLCDRLIVSTEPLRDLCDNMIDDIVVIPNTLETTVWSHLGSERNTSSKPRVGWAGAQQHSDDLAFIEEVVMATADEVEWVFFGMCPANIRSYVAEVHGFEYDFVKYAEKLASLNLDLAIAPLNIHPFNEAKSNLRLLEYGAMGWPVVCTDIYPYQNAPVKRVDNTARSWIAAIRERINDLDAAYQEGDELKKWVHSHYMMDQYVDVWTESLLPNEMKNTYRNLWQPHKKQAK